MMLHENGYGKQAVAINKDLLDPPRLEVDGRPVTERPARVVPPLAAPGEANREIVHDFRNILATIDSCLRLAERSLDEPETFLDFVAGAREGVSRGLRLTSQLLAMAQCGEVQARVEDANLLLENLALFLRCAAGSSIRVGFDLCPAVPSCRVDSSQFAAAILNLVINARDAMPDGGEIRISTARCDIGRAVTDPGEEGTYVRIRVRDNGPGMAEEIAKRIFDPLFTTKGERGSGLGIPQVCTFVRRAGGHVRVVSERHRGTTFDLLFPAIAPEASGTHAERETHSVNAVRRSTRSPTN